MNTLQTIYDKLADKTELAKHEVELALTDDLTKLVASNKNAVSEASRFIDNIKVTYNKLYSV